LTFRTKAASGPLLSRTIPQWQRGRTSAAWGAKSCKELDRVRLEGSLKLNNYPLRRY
jgi:hypothetical protein